MVKKKKNLIEIELRETIPGFKDFNRFNFYK